MRWDLYFLMEQQHIVIIEDDADMRDVMTQVLEADGYRVTAFAAITSLEDLLNAKADCFVLDEQLPFVSGHIICIMLKSKLATKEIPVILISASPSLEGHATLSQADAFLGKPFRHISDLPRTIQSVIEKKAALKELSLG